MTRRLLSVDDEAFTAAKRRGSNVDGGLLAARQRSSVVDEAFPAKKACSFDADEGPSYEDQGSLLLSNGLLITMKASSGS